MRHQHMPYHLDIYTHARYSRKRFLFAPPPHPATMLTRRTTTTTRLVSARRTSSVLLRSRGGPWKKLPLELLQAPTLANRSYVSSTIVYGTSFVCLTFRGVEWDRSQ